MDKRAPGCSGGFCRTVERVRRHIGGKQSFRSMFFDVKRSRRASAEFSKSRVCCSAPRTPGGGWAGRTVCRRRCMGRACASQRGRSDPRAERDEGCRASAQPRAIIFRLLVGRGGHPTRNKETDDMRSTGNPNCSPRRRPGFRCMESACRSPGYPQPKVPDWAVRRANPCHANGTATMQRAAIGMNAAPAYAS